MRYDTYILTKEDIVKFLMAKRYPLKAGIAMSKFYGMHIVIQNRGKVMAHDQTGIVYIRLSNQKKWHQINSTAQATDISADTTELAPFPLRIDASECFPESIYVQVVSTCYSDERFSKRTKVIDTMRAIYLTNSGDIQTSINPSDWVMDKIAPMTRILSTKPD